MIKMVVELNWSACDLNIFRVCSDDQSSRGMWHTVRRTRWLRRKQTRQIQSGIKHANIIWYVITVKKKNEDLRSYFGFDINISKTTMMITEMLQHLTALNNRVRPIYFID